MTDPKPTVTQEDIDSHFKIIKQVEKETKKEK